MTKGGLFSTGGDRATAWRLICPQSAAHSAELKTSSTSQSLHLSSQSLHLSSQSLHLSSQSLHPVIHGLRCKRHGASVKCLVDTIAAGGLGDRLLYHDSELGDRTARNLPGFLPRHQGHTTPDIIFLPAMEPNRAHTISLSQLTPEERVLVCVEVTHAADTRLSAAVADKLEQHSSWMHYLVQQGWQVTCFPVAVSHSGLVTSTARAALERCGVAPRQAATAVRRLVRSALAYNVQIRTSRRSLYAQTQPTAQNPPDPA